MYYVFASEFDADAAWISDPAVITDGAPPADRIRKTKPEVVYVRSDGYIGLRTESLDGHPLLRYLRLINRI